MQCPDRSNEVIRQSRSEAAGARGKADVTNLAIPQSHSLGPIVSSKGRFPLWFISRMLGTETQNFSKLAAC